MAILTNVPCGGIWLDDGSFKIMDNIITVIGATDVTDTTSVCGVLWDADVFGVGWDGDNHILTYVNAPDGKIMSVVKGNCGGFLGDARYFSLTNNVLSFQEGFILTVNVAPSTATPIIEVKQGGDIISPMTGTTNQFLMTELNVDYGIKVSAEGYSTKTQTVVSNKNETINIELSALESIAVTTPPDKVDYTAGDFFDPIGMVITATYADATTSDVTGYGWTPDTGLTAEDTTITITYQGQETTQVITVA